MEGDFERGDAVVIRAPDGRHLAADWSPTGRGGARPRRQEERRHRAILGFDGRSELVHRDDMVATGGG